MSRRLAPLLAALVPSGSMLIASQLEWVRSGSAGRNSYEMFRSAQRLGLDQLTPFRVLWFLLPVLCLGAVLMTVLTHRYVGAAFLGAGSVVSVGVGVAVLLSGLGAGPGAPMAAGAGFVGLVAVVVLVVGERRANSNQRA